MPLSFLQEESESHLTSRDQEPQFQSGSQHDGHQSMEVSEEVYRRSLPSHADENDDEASPACAQRETSDILGSEQSKPCTSDAAMAESSQPSTSYASGTGLPQTVPEQKQARKRRSDVKFLCKTCNKPQGSKNKLTRHRYEKHEDSKSGYSCPKCKKWFYTSKQLEAHSFKCQQ